MTTTSQRTTIIWAAPVGPMIPVEDYTMSTWMAEAFDMAWVQPGTMGDKNIAEAEAVCQKIDEVFSQSSDE